MSHTSRGLTPPNGPSGASGKIGKPMNVMASKTTAERNSGHVIVSTQPCSSSRAAKSRRRDCRAGGNAHVAEQRISAERKGQHAGDCRRRREVSSGLVLVASEERDDGAVCGERHAENDGEARGASRRLFRQGLRQRGDHAAEQARERERADSRRAAPWRCSAPAPAAFEPDQEADAERDGKAGNQLLKVHGRPGHQIRSVLGVIGPNV